MLDDKDVAALEFHPLAGAIPEMSEDEYRELVDSISRNGLREPIVLFEGKILDGRHRWRACRELGLSTTCRPFEGSLREAIELVADVNLCRRHLEPGQRALAAIELCTMIGSRGGRPKKTSSTEEVSRAEAAKLAGVSPGSIDRAITICLEPDLAQAVRQGKMTLRAAEAKLRSRREQAELGSATAADRKPANARRPASGVLLDIPDPGSDFWARLYCADALDVLDSTERPDLIVTDPPFGIKLRHKKHGVMKNDESMDVGYAVLALAIGRLKPGGQIYVFGDRKKPFDLEKAGGPLIHILEPIIWNKGRHAAGDCYRPWGPSWEYISVGERLPDPEDAADREVLRAIHEKVHPDPQDAIPPSMRDEIQLPFPPPLAFDPTDRKAIKAALKEGRADRTRFRRPALIQYPRCGSRRDHPTEKPVELLKELIGVSSFAYDLVCDPFCGVGSTGVAALQLGRRFLGIELDEEFARVAAERIASARCGSIEEVMAEEVRLGLGEKLRQWFEEDGIEIPESGG
jgi:DNA modification methylase